jgi:hypothetical protein
MLSADQNDLERALTGSEAFLVITDAGSCERAYRLRIAGGQLFTRVVPARQPSGRADAK